MKLSKALTILAPNIIAHLDVYRVGRADQSSVLPQALWISPEELAALRAVIDFAALPSRLLKAAKAANEATGKEPKFKHSETYAALTELMNAVEEAEAE